MPKFIPAIFFLTFLLTSCQHKEKNYTYYMQHPFELKNAITACQSSNEQNSQCEMIMRAAVNMSAIVNQLQEDPEKFGETVLVAQQRLMQLKSDAVKAEQSLCDVKAKKAAPAEVKAAEDNLENSKKLFKDQLAQVKTFLAVLGMGSPD